MKKNMKYLIIFIIVCLLGVGIFVLFLMELNGSLDIEKIIVNSSKDGWSSNDITLTINYSDSKARISEYSFDGGHTWQKNNTYVVSENKNIDIVLKSSAGMKTGIKTYSVKNIDKEGPVINVETPIQVTKGTTFDINDYINVSDNVSGVKGKISITPSTVGTSELGSTEVTIRAVDNAGNETIKEITVQVLEEEAVNEEMNINKIKEYRFRKITRSCEEKVTIEDVIYEFGNVTCDMYNGFVYNNYCLSDYTIYDGVCDNGIVIDGKCHEIKSTAKPTCENGTYDEESNQCIIVTNSCKESFGEWSEWTRDEIKKSDGIEIEIREVEE